MFKETFKSLKAKWPVPDFSEVIDTDDLTEKTQNLVLPLNLDVGIMNTTLPPGILPLHTWRCFTLPNNPGLILIRNPFTVQGQRYWMTRCLRDYPCKPNVVNLNKRLFENHVIDDWWQALQECSNKDERRRIKVAMRWTTLGYHHDWDTKIYDNERYTEFPSDLARLTGFFAKILNFENYEAQASIVNYYPLGTTLAGHTDHSEVDLEAPLFSFSFGQTAIFLIGGHTKEEKPSAILLKSGDVLVMSKESRLCYHAVPRVMKAQNELWNQIAPLNERAKSAEQPKLKRLKIDQECTLRQEMELKSLFEKFSMDLELFEQVVEEDLWQPFKMYLNDSRININIRQVLKHGMTELGQVS